ncbi:MAG: hypothetical protein IPM29_25830 [Planctomycetes bacterium]|nr:hypothetical protein [Planctomycetota bacterium]
MRSLPIVSLALSLLAAPSAIAQFGGSGADGVFAPTADVTLDTDARPAGFDFVSIHVPAGVTVRVVGNRPGILRSRTTIRIDGVLSADGFAADGANPGAGGAGGYAGGAPGVAGDGPAGGQAGMGTFVSNQFGGNAGHATPGTGLWMQPTGTYGSALPFDLRGGSGGGGYASVVTGEQLGGDGGGGVLVLLADGRIDIPGAVTADGAGVGTTRTGAGGAILIRSATDVHVSGRVSADGPQDTLPGPISGHAGDGFVRIDAWIEEPVIAPSAVIVPEPSLRALPDLESSLATRGEEWLLHTRAVPSDLVAFLLSGDSRPSAIPGLGTYGLGAPEATDVVGYSVVEPRPDAAAFVVVPIPNDPRLLGVTLWAQAVTARTASAEGPRLTPYVSRTIR